MNQPGSILRLGLIGCGRIAERAYLPALARLPHARLAAVADPRRERRELLAAAVAGCRPLATADALLAAGDLDGVIIATLPESHVALAEQALAAGLPVLVEKPLALVTEGLPELARLAAGVRAPVMVGFNRRYWTPVRRLRAHLQKLPARDQVRAQLLFIARQDAWQPVAGGAEPLFDLGSHQLDLLAHLTGDPVITVSARWHEGGPADGITMQVGLAGGARAECRAARTGSTVESIRLEDGAGGRYYIHTASEECQPADGALRRLFDVRDAVGRRLLGRRSSLRDSYRRQLADFLRQVQAFGAGEPIVTGPGAGLVDGMAAVAAAAAARRSADHGGREEMVRFNGESMT